MKEVDPRKRLQPGDYAWYRRRESAIDWEVESLFHVDEDGSYHNRIPGQHRPFTEHDWRHHKSGVLFLKPNKAKIIKKLVSLNTEEAEQLHEDLAEEYAEEELQVGDCFTLFAYKNYEQRDEEAYPAAIVRVVDFGRSMASGGVRYVIAQIISRNNNPERADLEVDPHSYYAFYRADPMTRTIDFTEELKPRVRDLDLGSFLAIKEVPDYMTHDPESCRLSTEEAVEAEPMWEYLEPRQ